MYDEKTKKFKPNGNEKQCQCVMEHITLTEGGIEQCNSIRDRQTSNLYCTHCEETHGDALSRKTVKA